MPFRAIEVKHSANAEKIRQIKALFPAARKTARSIAAYQWKLFFKNGSFNRKGNIKQIKSQLSERYKYTVQYHVVVPELESFLSNVQNRFEKIVLNSTLPEKTKKVLLYLSSRRGFLHRKSEKAFWVEIKNGKAIKEELEITDEGRLIAKKIFKGILRRWRRPSFKDAQLVLDSKCAIIESSSKAKNFSIWLRVSTLEEGKPVYVPVSLHEYFVERGGALTTMVQIIEDGEGIKIRLVKDVPQKEYRGAGVVALDFGLNFLFASDKGALLGRTFYGKVKRYAQQIDILDRNLRRQGIKPSSSKRYRRLQERLKAYVKNEIRRILNRVVERYTPEVIVVENLRGFLREVINDFPKSVKRIFIRFGLGETRKKLAEIAEEYGIKVVEINPAYSLQSCSSCGYVDEENRRVRDQFECQVCRKNLHADVNAARNLKERFLAGWAPFTRR
jgi:putative transposase